jgi:hypothetical protein
MTETLPRDAKGAPCPSCNGYSDVQDDATEEELKQ